MPVAPLQRVVMGVDELEDLAPMGLGAPVDIGILDKAPGDGQVVGGGEPGVRGSEEPREEDRE